VTKRPRPQPEPDVDNAGPDPVEAAIAATEPEVVLREVPPPISPVGPQSLPEALQAAQTVGVLTPEEREQLRIYLAQEAHYRATLQIVQQARGTYLEARLRDRHLVPAEDGTSGYHVDEETGVIRLVTWPSRED